MDTMSINLTRQVRAHKSAGDYGKAFEVLLETLTNFPALAGPQRDEFMSILINFNVELEECDRKADIFANFEKALKIYPNCHNILHEMAKVLFMNYFYKEAWAHWEKVLLLNPQQVSAEKSLDTVKNLLVERWHFRMLNDNLRNEAYRRAIQDEVHATDKVIDVGTGSGLLAIYACEAGATDIIACDGSETMIEIANAILQENKLNNNIKLLNKMSSSMNSHDLNGQATLLLTEMFDAGLVGEHVLQMLQHAWSNLLSQQARVIPNRAEFFIAGAQCNNLNMKYQLSPEAKKLLNLGTMNVHVFVPNETYDCEDVHLQDIKYLTEPQSVLNVNFNDLNDIEMHLNRTEPYKVELKATESGIINIMIGWFNLYLSDTITITTDPRSEARCNAWQHAVFFDEIPRTVEEGDIIKLEFLMNGGHLTLKPSSDTDITRVSLDIIRFLNDEDYINNIISGLPIATIYLSQIDDMSQICIADMCPFPVFGLLMMKRGASSLVCFADDEQDKEFIEEVFKKNDISITNVTVVVAYENSQYKDVFGEEKFHTLFAHFLELGGDVSNHKSNLAHTLKTFHLHRGGLYIPDSLRIVGQLISSRWLDINNMVYDENVNMFKMAKFVNKYSVNINYYSDFSTLKYVPLTNAVDICRFTEGEDIHWNTALVTKDGYANAILCSYKIKLIKGLKPITTSRPNSFMGGMLFMTSPKQSIVAGGTVRILQIMDHEGSFKLTFTDG